MEVSRCVVTGATSFIGRYLVHQLISRGYTVFAVIRPSSVSRNVFSGTDGVTSILADMGNTEQWKSAIGQADYFFHLGWDGQGPQGRADLALQEQNAARALSCLRAAAELGCSSFLMAGSQSEYGIQYDVITEELPCRPVLAYAKGKLAVCRAALPLSAELGIKYYHARIFSVYGPGDHERTLIPTCIRTLCAGDKMALSSCEQLWNFMAVDEAAEVLCSLALGGGESGVYNVASTDTRPLKEFVQEIYELCGKKGRLAFQTYEPSEKPANLRPNIQKLQKAIGPWEHRDFTQELRAMIQTYQETGVL